MSKTDNEARKPLASEKRTTLNLSVTVTDKQLLSDCSVQCVNRRMLHGTNKEYI